MQINDLLKSMIQTKACLWSQSFDLTFKLQQQLGPQMVNLLPLVCLIYSIFLKIYQNMTATNSANTVKLRNLFYLVSNPEKIFFRLRFHVTALFEKSQLIVNWIINQHQFTSLLESIDKKIFEFFNNIWLLTSLLPPSLFLLGGHQYLKQY